MGMPACVCVYAWQVVPNSRSTLFAYVWQPSVLIVSAMSLLGYTPCAAARKSVPTSCQCWIGISTTVNLGFCAALHEELGGPQRNHLTKINRLGGFFSGLVSYIRSSLICCFQMCQSPDYIITLARDTNSFSSLHSCLIHIWLKTGKEKNRTLFTFESCIEYLSAKIM